MTPNAEKAQKFLDEHPPMVLHGGPQKETVCHSLTASYDLAILLDAHVAPWRDRVERVLIDCQNDITPALEDEGYALLAVAEEEGNHGTV